MFEGISLKRIKASRCDGVLAMFSLLKHAEGEEEAENAQERKGLDGISKCDLATVADGFVILEVITGHIQF